MTPEDKELLLKDLCARLPYGVVGVNSKGFTSPLIVKGEADWDILTSLNYRIVKYGWKPYLRAMSGMTKEEIDKYDAELDKDADIVLDGALDKEQHITSDGKHSFSKNFVEHFGNDWLDKNMFDYRGLIPMGLALEAPEGMYNLR